MSQQVIEIPVDELQPNPLQPRGVITPESLTDLIESIRQHGILEPLVVAKTPAGYQIIAGERRWRSAKILGLKEVPAIVKETNPRQMLEWALIENVQREDLGPLDRAKAFERLEVEFGLSLAEIAEKIGKSEAYISNSIRLLSLPDAVKDGLLSGLISEGHARAIAGLKPPEKIVTAYKQILKEKASVRRAEEIARLLKDQNEALIREKEKETKENLDQYQEIEREIKESFPPTTRVSLSRSRTQTKITLVFRGGLTETEEDLKDFLRRIKS